MQIRIRKSECRWGVEADEMIHQHYHSDGFPYAGGDWQIVAFHADDDLLVLTLELQSRQDGRRMTVAFARVPRADAALREVMSYPATAGPLHMGRYGLGASPASNFAAAAAAGIPEAVRRRDETQNEKEIKEQIAVLAKPDEPTCLRRIIIKERKT